MNEFELINRYFNRGFQRSDVQVGIGDDAAVLEIPRDHELLVSMDTLISGVHFPVNTTPYDIGYKSVAVNLSDLAAMGGTPAWLTLALTLPQADESWLAEFSRGFFEAAAPWNVQLIGGDVTRGDLSITVQAHGFAAKNQAILRRGARVGDLIYVSGYLGLAAWGLQGVQRGEPSVVHPLALERLQRPEPRVKLGQALRGIASAMIDVSDGLVSDLTHILKASAVRATLNVDQLPLHSAMVDALGFTQAVELALAGGDDYELCFTVPQKNQAEVASLGCMLIGKISAGEGILLLNGEGASYSLQKSGYQHF